MPLPPRQNAETDMVLTSVGIDAAFGVRVWSVPAGLEDFEARWKCHKPAR